MRPGSILFEIKSAFHLPELEGIRVLYQQIYGDAVLRDKMFAIKMICSLMDHLMDLDHTGMRSRWRLLLSHDGPVVR